MPDLLLKTPLAAGATRVKLLMPDGSTRSDLNAPGDEVMTVPDARAGDYAAVVQPLGAAPQYYRFTYREGMDEIDLAPNAAGASTTRVEALGPFGRETTRKPPSSAREPRDRWPATLAVTTNASSEPLFFLGAAARTTLPLRNPEATSVPLQEKVAANDTDYAAPEAEALLLSIGISRDVLPFSPGGWRPYDGASPEISHTADEAVLVFKRGREPLPEPQFARLRLSARLRGGPVHRALVPLFEGGTKIALRPRRDGSRLVDLVIAPLDTDKLALVQALAAATASEGQKIFDLFSARHDPARFIIDGAPSDPWTAILGGLVKMRFSENFEDDYVWLDALPKQFGWIADALILGARKAVIASNRKPDYFKASRTEALWAIKRARRIGAPYFFFANAMSGDILAALSSKPSSDKEAEPDEFEKEVWEERARWQQFIRAQSQAGAFFSWRTHVGYAEAVQFDARYVTTLASDLAF